MIRSVKFLGLLAIQDVQMQLGEAHCLTLVSVQENAPLAIGEEMAAGVPILASNIGGIPWMVDEGVTGCLVDPNAEESIVCGMQKMLANNGIGKMGLAAKSWAEKYFHIGIVAKQTLEVYKQILAR